MRVAVPHNYHPRIDQVCKRRVFAVCASCLFGPVRCICLGSPLISVRVRRQWQRQRPLGLGPCRCLTRQRLSQTGVAT